MVDVVETVAAAIGCAVVAGFPVLIGALVMTLVGAGAGCLTIAMLTIAVIVLPARWPMPEQPRLSGYERWGHRVGRALGAPIRWREARILRRSQRAIGASSASSSAAAPSLPPRRR